ncbi:unnamed protein product [Penicillium roqueforti FM164]|uniref:Uncharacterized protein n=1 Tax=Penicillium roqueforti (strain FM164) TaxID=1365484 RepID=W6QPM6_PENRF|nr:unnamed protein product [Penicillium roqueforti FM164]
MCTRHIAVDTNLGSNHCAQLLLPTLRSLLDFYLLFTVDSPSTLGRDGDKGSRTFRVSLTSDRPQVPKNLLVKPAIAEAGNDIIGN